MQRRELLKGLAAATGLALGHQALDAHAATGGNPMTTVQAADGTDLFIKDWGTGTPLLFVHSWATSNEIWQYQHAHFVEAGYRVIAFDRRGHGRSGQPGAGYDADTLADDLARVIAAKNLKGVTLIGHSMGCAEIVRYLSRHGAARVARIVLAAPTTPFLLKTADNPDGIDGQAFAMLRAGWRKDFPKWLRDNVRPFFAPDTSEALLDWGVTMMSQIPLHVALACNKALVETDFRPDLARISVPSLVLHGTHDASAPIALTGQRTAAQIPGAQYKVYDGAPHGLMFTHADQLNADIEAFLRT
jgi:pimeloyl-ACP methyl ester carboxylesterase